MRGRREEGRCWKFLNCLLLYYVSYKYIHLRSAWISKLICNVFLFHCYSCLFRPLVRFNVPLANHLPFAPNTPFYGVDVFDMYRQHWYLFWLNTGKLPETLEHIVAYVTLALGRTNRNGDIRQRQRRGKLNLKNQVLLVMMLLRKYPCLALLFDVSRQTISAIIYHVVPILWIYFASQVTWPTIAECYAGIMAIVPKQCWLCQLNSAQNISTAGRTAAWFL